MSGYDPKRRRGHRDAAPDEPAPVDALLGPPPGEPAADDTAPAVGEPAEAAALAPVPGVPVAGDEVDGGLGIDASPTGATSIRDQVAAIEREVAEAAATGAEPTAVPHTVPAETRPPATAPAEPGAQRRRPPLVPVALAVVLAAVAALVVVWLRRRRR